MRLNKNQIQIIKKYFKEVFHNGDLYLFGSRAIDSEKGGDIDLYLVLDDHSDLFKKKIRFLSNVKRDIGDQKIDLVFNIDETRLIAKEAIQWGIKL